MYKSLPPVHTPYIKNNSEWRLKMKQDIYINITRKHILTFAILIAAILTYIFSDDSKADVNIQEDIAEKVIRFHVLANSDSEEDQALKLKVKDAVVDYLRPYMTDAKNLEESINIINEKQNDILKIASSTIASEGYNYHVNAYICQDYFPTKSYGDVTFPAGEYTAYRIEIGAHEGKNWWCILYPPLCFVDASYGVLPDESKQMLKNVLDEDEFSVITEETIEENTKFRFKFFTFINQYLE